MRLENSVIEEVKNSVDIVDVISNYVSLTSKGKNFFGVCPFHDDHSPSMSVSKERQIYTCFSCGATGNVFKFISDFENISFIEAVKKVADIGGVNVDLGNYKPKENKYQNLYDMYDLSLKFYQNNINSKLGDKAREYLKTRNIDNEIIKEFGIGLSLNKKDMLTNLLKSKGYKDEELITSGLVNENNLELNDIYKNRIMFPLFDLNGKPIGFNGRVYNGETENKYVNSKETPIFKKRELLYNYHRAKDAARIKKYVILMEGQLDTIRAYTIGYKNVVATLGTAFGPEQAMLVRKLSNNVILCFDGDEAGLKATKSAINELDKLGISPKIIRFSDNMDPDEYILKYGEKGFSNEIKNSMNVIEFKEKELKNEYNLNDTLELTNYINKMIQEINLIDDDILREVSINKLSKETGVEVNLLKSKLDNRSDKDKYTTKKVNIKMDKYTKSEAYIIYYMLMSKDVIKMYEKKITRMPTEKYRKLAFLIDCFYKENKYIDVSSMISYLNDDKESIDTIGEILQLNLKEDIDYDELEDYFNNIREYNIKIQTNNIKNKLKNESDYNKKLEYAKKALEIKKGSAIDD